MKQVRHGVYFEVTERDYALYKELQTAIMRHHGKIRGVLGKEIIRLAYTNPEIIEKKQKVMEPKIRTSTKDKLLSIYQQLPPKGMFNEKTVERAIEEQAGVSAPTKASYKSILRGNMMIIPLSSFGPPKYERGILPEWLGNNGQRKKPGASE